ncbi:hypothetical protein OSB04_un001061 [Centaurea solstitialis]|uniref:Reverse transcriptase zinc-binding domain-containing protein n=1 Tax=Centaurea solstitialis TaxID=347529 RepID=A0AA38S4Q9_9ASTR|nr:hypothetical protein OSB04_un001061 [Centaurea solstitialis]
MACSVWLRYERAIDDMTLRRCGPPTVWNMLLPSKVRICGWRARLGRILVKENLLERGVSLENDRFELAMKRENPETIFLKATEVRCAVNNWMNLLPMNLLPMNFPIDP